MDKAGILARIEGEGLIPVVRAASSDEALRLVDALRAGGVSIIEVTMTVPGAVDVIRGLAARHAELLVGAGTVLDGETARACMDAGARFIVSPATDRETIDFCKRLTVPVVPGALTPTEIQTAWEAGADAVKVFPCSAMGGAPYIRTLKTLFPDIPLVPTGGVTLATAADFIRAGAFALGVGTDLADVGAIRTGHPEAITTTAEAYRAAIAAARRR